MAHPFTLPLILAGILFASIACSDGVEEVPATPTATIEVSPTAHETGSLTPSPEPRQPVQPFVP